MIKRLLLALLALSCASASADTIGVTAWNIARLSGLSTTVQTVKQFGGRLGMLQCYNPNSSPVYIQIFNVAAASVTLGTTVSIASIPIAPTSTGGFPQSQAGINVSGPISVAATTTATGSGQPSTAPDCNMTYL